MQSEAMEQGTSVGDRDQRESVTGVHFQGEPWQAEAGFSCAQN
jgi:hypothetical protein